MLEKKSGGDRIIGLVGTIPRVWSNSRDPWISAWSTDTQPFWGAAVAGNAALREGFARALSDE
eukprot:1552726-Pyramimonas_sp.AAC.1